MSRQLPNPFLADEAPPIDLDFSFDSQAFLAAIEDEPVQPEKHRSPPKQVRPAIRPADNNFDDLFILANIVKPRRRD